MSPPPPAISSIGQIALTVGDVARATSFYRDVLGLSFLFSAGPNLASLAAGGVRLMLTTPQGHGEVGKNSILYFKVAGIEAARAATVARGATNERAPQLTAKMPDPELWIGFVRDPDGNLGAVDGRETLSCAPVRPRPAARHRGSAGRSAARAS
jgi:predicted enzyme related to lactoylglutathione lyase